MGSSGGGRGARALGHGSAWGRGLGCGPSRPHGSRGDSVGRTSTCRTTPASSWTCTCRGNGKHPRALLFDLFARPHCAHVPQLLFIPFPFRGQPCALFSSISSASNRIIGAKDHASIQMNVAEVSWEPGGEACSRRKEKRRQLGLSVPGVLALPFPNNQARLKAWGGGRIS